MENKNSLLKALGWSDELIKHFMIDEKEDTDEVFSELTEVVYDTNSFTVSCNHKLSDNSAIIMVSNNNRIN